MADVSSLDYLKEGSGQEESNDASVVIFLDELDLTTSKPAPTKTSTTIVPTTKKQAKGKSHSRKNHRKGHLSQHEPITKTPEIQSEPEFSPISNSFDSDESMVEPTVIPVNMEMINAEADQSMQINEVSFNRVVLFLNLYQDQTRKRNDEYYHSIARWNWWINPRGVLWTIVGP